MKQAKMENIRGWGADLDPARRPGVPREKYPAYGTGAHWRIPDQQYSKVKVFHSVERPFLTPVFGTSCPPIGLSGKVRAFAYRISESKPSHWMLLLIADRINVTEGILQDLSRGRLPNIFAEMGGAAEFKYNRRSVEKIIDRLRIPQIISAWQLRRAEAT